MRIPLFARVLVAALALSLAACGPDEVNFDTLESARTTAKSNARYNAKKFRTDHPQFAEFDLEMQGDSTQTPACPQGDGWASGKLVNLQTKAQVEIKCSTVSNAVGCLTKADFTGKPYAGDEGNCQPVKKVPFPLPKVAE